jgi:4-hydroxybenzoate polyprenyltransferase
MGPTADPPPPVHSSAAASLALRTWLQLLRAPNLFTVPGDPLAGFLLATFGVLRPAAFFAVGASLCFYAAGLLLNDLCDIEEDRRERKTRPLPSGAANVRTVRVAACALALAGLGSLVLAAGTRGLCVGLALCAAIATYNMLTKRWEIIGALNMGLCRALSLYAGSVVAYPTAFPRTKSVILGASIIGIYIAAVTNLARHETSAHVPATAKVFPFLAALLGMVLLSLGTGALFLSPATACCACAAVLALRETILLFPREPSAVGMLPPRIGAFIRLLLLLQAALCLVVPLSEMGWACAIVLLLCYPLHGWLARRFYAS